MIKLILLTGFLGSGKTTLLKNILNEYSNKKIGVIINEFGKISVDGALLKKDGIKMIELMNGSIFCSCLKANFINSLIEMSKYEFEYLFVEASGLADPSNMEDILDAIKLHIKNEYSYMGSICVIDSENFMDLYDLLPAIVSQIEYSSAVIINKVDLIEDQDLKSILRKVKEINISTDIYETSYCNVNINQIVESMGYNDKNSKESSNTYESRPRAFILESQQKISKEGLLDFIKSILKSTYRVKGFAITDLGNFEINAVNEHIEMNPYKEGLLKTEIVVISSVGIKIIGVMAEGLKKLPGLKMHV